MSEPSLPPPAARGADEKYCTNCGSVISARTEICPKCGVRQLPVPNVLGRSTPGGRNRIAAAVFAILLGGLGIHKFYLGRIWQGILYVVFCWTSFPRSSALSKGSST
jgi:hypothetical protein